MTRQEKARLYQVLLVIVGTPFVLTHFLMKYAPATVIAVATLVVVLSLVAILGWCFAPIPANKLRTHP